MRKKKMIEKNIEYYSRVYSPSSKAVLNLKERLKSIEDQMKRQK